MTVRIEELYDERYGEYGRYFKASKSPVIHVNSDFIATVGVEEVNDMNGDKFNITHITICAYSTTFNVYTAMVPEDITKQMGDKR